MTNAIPLINLCWLFWAKFLKILFYANNHLFENLSVYMQSFNFYPIGDWHSRPAPAHLPPPILLCVEFTFWSEWNTCFFLDPAVDIYYKNEHLQL